MAAVAVETHRDVGYSISVPRVTAKRCSNPAWSTVWWERPRSECTAGEGSTCSAASSKDEVSVADDVTVVGHNADLHASSASPSKQRSHVESDLQARKTSNAASAVSPHLDSPVHLASRSLDSTEQHSTPLDSTTAAANEDCTQGLKPSHGMSTRSRSKHVTPGEYSGDECSSQTVDRVCGVKRPREEPSLVVEQCTRAPSSSPSAQAEEEPDDEPLLESFLPPYLELVKVSYAKLCEIVADNPAVLDLQYHLNPITLIVEAAQASNVKLRVMEYVDEATGEDVAVVNWRCKEFKVAQSRAGGTSATRQAALLALRDEEVAQNLLKLKYSSKKNQAVAIIALKRSEVDKLQHTCPQSLPEAQDPWSLDDPAAWSTEEQQHANDTIPFLTGSHSSSRSQTGNAVHDSHVLPLDDDFEDVLTPAKRCKVEDEARAGMAPCSPGSDSCLSDDDTPICTAAALSLPDVLFESSPCMDELHAFGGDYAYFDKSLLACRAWGPPMEDMLVCMPEDMWLEPACCILAA